MAEKHTYFSTHTGLPFLDTILCICGLEQTSEHIFPATWYTMYSIFSFFIRVFPLRKAIHANIGTIMYSRVSIEYLPEHEY